ncbi:MAG: hypothetical protein EP310_04475 [Bacteroidetes bacterium]|nr:MAG: hypothetical protein EP310_04475 [Bacteroidota bacterium]
MKAFKAIFLLVFVSGICFATAGFAQVEKSKNENFTFTIASKTDRYDLTGVEIIKITPVGNLLRIVTCKVGSDNSIMDLANPVAFFRVTATGDFDGDGEDEILVDEFAVLTKTGNLKFVYHLNEKNK